MTTAALHQSLFAVQPVRPPRARPEPGSRPRLRLTPRGRAVLAGVVLLPLAIAASVFSWGAASATATDGGSSSTFEYVQVESGQSLWQIAATIAPEADPREVVSDVVHLNGLQSSDVQPGQRLAVPEVYAN